MSTNTHTSRGASFIALPGALPLHTYIHTHRSSCVQKICLMMTHTHTHAYAWLLAQTYISLSRLQERFPCTRAALHATCVLISPVCDESSWVETVILQILVWDIRAWSARFLVWRIFDFFCKCNAWISKYVVKIWVLLLVETNLLTYNDDICNFGCGIRRALNEHVFCEFQITCKNLQ